MDTDHFEKIFTKYFQRQISIKINDEEIKTGKFLLIQNNIINNNFYFDLIIENTKKVIVFKIPFPFAVDEYLDEGLLYFDYRFKTFAKKKAILLEVERLAETLSVDKYSKFYDSIVEIQFK